MRKEIKIAVAVIVVAVMSVFCLAVGIVEGTKTERRKELNAVSNITNNVSTTQSSEADVTTTTAAATKSEEPYSTVPEAETKIPMSEWGFNNSDDWGNKLVKVVANPDDYMDKTYDGFNDEYVIIGEGSEFWDFYPETGQFTQGSFYFDEKQISMASSYVILDNDTMSAPSMGGAFQIDERIVVGDVVFFRRGSNYYIPYKMLDLERVEFYKEDGILDDYKVYLK